MRVVLTVCLVCSLLTGCAAYGALVDTVTAPIIAGQQAAEKKRQAKGATDATPPAPSGMHVPGQ